jgi:hypothetical protein
MCGEVECLISVPLHGGKPGTSAGLLPVDEPCASVGRVEDSFSMPADHFVPCFPMRNRASATSVP